ncbi:MAG: hypothetical protein AB7N91_27340 [Candidatus Tectimicrobiota bacterium]
MDWHSSGITTAVVGRLKRGRIPERRRWGSVCVAVGTHRRA